MRRLVSTLLLVVALGAPLMAALAVDARAGVSYESPYTVEQTFGTALRLLRVDMGLKITEKDVENGYLLFEYTSPESGRRVTQGAVEIVGGKDRVHVSVQLPEMPQYHEQVIIDALAKKLVAEHGEPPRKSPPPPPPEPPADAGADAAPAG